MKTKVTEHYYTFARAPRVLGVRTAGNITVLPSLSSKALEPMKVRLAARAYQQLGPRFHLTVIKCGSKHALTATRWAPVFVGEVG